MINRLGGKKSDLQFRFQYDFGILFRKIFCRNRTRAHAGFCDVPATSPTPVVFTTKTAVSFCFTTAPRAFIRR